MFFLKNCFICPFLVIIILLLFFFNGIKASHEVFRNLQSLSSTNTIKYHRTGYHFQPPKHWINGMYFLSYTS